MYGGGARSGPSRRRRWIWIGAGLVLLLVALWLIYGATAPPATQVDGGPGGRGAGGGRGRGGGRSGAGGLPTSVNAARAVRGEMPIYLNELGTATPPATVTIIPQISGVLQQVAFREGQMVRKGQYLAQIDPRPYQALLTQAQGALAKDKAALAEAQRDLARYRKLLAEDSINSQQVDVQAATVEQDIGQVKADQGSVQTQTLNLTYCHITSPVSGRVGLRQVDPGNFISAGVTTGLVVVTVLNPMDVLFTLPEDNLAEVSARLRAGATLAADAFDRTQTTLLSKGSLLTLDNQVDTTTGTVRAKARFNNADGALFPNQFVNIRLTVDTLKNAVIVPTSAILKGPNGMFVYRASRQGREGTTAVVTPVTVGPATGETSAILHGLEPGAVVVTDGSDRLKDGSRVVLPGDCIPAGRGGGGRGGAAPQGGPGAKPKGGIYGLFVRKPAEDPLAALRCRPGQHPSSLLSGGGGGGAINAGGAFNGAAGGDGAPSSTPTTSRTSVTRRGPQTASRQPPPDSPADVQTASPPAEDGDQGGAGRGRGGGRLAAMASALSLDPGQQRRWNAILAQAQEQAAASDDPRAVYKGAVARLEPLLRPDQKAKLEQMRAEAAARRAARGGGDGG